MIGVNIVLPGVSLHEYDALFDEVAGPDLDDDNLPDEIHVNVAGTSDGDICIFQIWETKRDFAAFWENSVERGMKKLGVAVEPHIDFFQIHEAQFRRLSLEDDADDEKNLTDDGASQSEENVVNDTETPSEE